jgi:hypothetical protein
MISTTSDATTQTKSNEEPADGEASGAPPPQPAPSAADSEGTTTGSSFVIAAPSQSTNQGDEGTSNPIAATTQTTNQEEPAYEPASGAEDPKDPQDGDKDAKKATQKDEWVVVPTEATETQEEKDVVES